MSEHERFAWASLVASVVVWAFFGMRLSEGGQLLDVGARHLVWTYVATVLLMVISHAAIAAVLGSRPRGAELEDERDQAIAARADRLEGWVVVGLINVLVIHALADSAFPGRALPRLDLSSVSTLVFALITTLFVGHVVKQVATIWMYRA